MDADRCVPADQEGDRARLERCLVALGRMLDDGSMAAGNAGTGVELEVALVDAAMQPATINRAVLGRTSSDLLTSELGSWTLEINLPPHTLPETADGVLENDIRTAVREADASARGLGARAVTIGILPTLEPAHLDGTQITDEARYTQLDERVRNARGDRLDLDIASPVTEGPLAGERVALTLGSVAAEAACTSFQLHLQLAPESLAGHWNAAQAIAGVQVALAANSPFLLGRRLWAETRVPLFTQSVDTRTNGQRARGAPPRVWFGRRWVSSAYELFAENVHRFDVLLPLADDAPDPDAPDPVEVLDDGGVPALSALGTHNSTVWQWNRPIYDVADGVAHLRLENRVLPAAPTALDAAADALFFYGLVRALAEQDRPVWHDLSFADAEANFVAGSRLGIEATLAWPGRRTVRVTELVLDDLLPRAEQGLASWGVDPGSISRYLSVIEGRCRTRRTGATWQVDVVRSLEAGGVGRREAMGQMLERYLAGTASGEPVHTWPVG